MDTTVAPDYVTFEHEGKECRQISYAYKLSVLRDYAEKYKLKNCVETGTYMGDSLGDLRSYFERLYSIELREDYFLQAKERFKDCPEVTLIHGDSATELPKLLPTLKEPVLFWLDAHGENWIGPIIKEMKAIFASQVKGAMLVDDIDYMPDVLPEHPDWKSDGSAFGILRLLHVG